jgi:hypothetical protein
MNPIPLRLPDFAKTKNNKTIKLKTNDNNIDMLPLIFNIKLINAIKFNYSI